MARPPGWQWHQRLRRPSPAPIISLVLLLPLVLLFWTAAAFVTPSPALRQRHGRMSRMSSSNNEGGPPASFKGFGLLEWANKVVPQKAIVKTARFSWNMLWKV